MRSLRRTKVRHPGHSERCYAWRPVRPCQQHGNDTLHGGGGNDWLEGVGNNLRLTLYETGHKLTVQNWHSGATYRVRGFDLGNSKALLENQVDNLVSAMAAFSPPVAGQTSLPANYQETLDSVIVANWK